VEEKSNSKGFVIVKYGSSTAVFLIPCTYPTAVCTNLSFTGTQDSLLRPCRSVSTLK
jgi:hypothetical protein